jgi:hypothetical protein
MIYKVQRIILLVCYSITVMVLSIPLARLLAHLFPDNLYPLAATLVLYMILAVVAGSLIHTISYIPFHLAASFDPIKNAIASGEISDMEELGRRITEFTTRFFDFAFLDIDHAFLHTEQTGPVSHEELSPAYGAIGEFGLPEKSRQQKEVMRAGKISLGNREFHLYILPIWFGDRWLGYMGLLTRRRISRFYQKFLSELENNFLDDQIAHVIRRNV